MIRSAEIEHQIRFSISRTSKFSEARKVVRKTRKKGTSYEGKGSLLTKDLITWFAKWYCIGVFSDRGRRTTNWLGPWKVPSNYGCCWKGMPYLPNFHAKIDSTITIYFGHNFTKVTTFIIIIIKNNYKNCYLGKSIWEGSLV